MRTPAMAVILVSAVALSACAGLASTPSPSEPTESQTAIGTVDPTVDGTAAPTPSMSPTPAEPVQQLLIANPDGIHVLFSDGTKETLVDDMSGAVAYDDLHGGVIFQTSREVFDPDADTTIWRLAPGSDEPSALIAPGPGEGLRLFGVDAIDGESTLVFTSRSGDELDNLEILRYLALGSGVATDVTVVGGYESGANVVSHGNGLFLVDGGGEGYHWFNFFDAEGNLVPQPHNPMGDDCFFDDPSCPTVGEIAPNGTSVVFLIPKPDDPAKQLLRRVHLTTGEVLGATVIAIPEDEFADSIDFVAGLTVINRKRVTTGLQTIRALLIEQLDGGTAEVVALPGHAQIIRVPIEFP